MRSSAKSIKKNLCGICKLQCDIEKSSTEILWPQILQRMFRRQCEVHSYKLNCFHRVISWQTFPSCSKNSETKTIKRHWALDSVVVRVLDRQTTGRTLKSPSGQKFGSRILPHQRHLAYSAASTQTVHCWLEDDTVRKIIVPPAVIICGS